MNKLVNIKTTSETFFKQYLNILEPIIRISGKEAEVLSELMYQNYLKRNIPEDDRFKLIFSSSIRSVMQDRLNISGAIFRNAITKLRKLGVIVDNRLAKSFIFDVQDEMNISFKFKVTDDSQL